MACLHLSNVLRYRQCKLVISQDTFPQTIIMFEYSNKRMCCNQSQEKRKWKANKSYKQHGSHCLSPIISHVTVAAAKYNYQHDLYTFWGKLY